MGSGLVSCQDVQYLPGDKDSDLFIDFSSHYCTHICALCDVGQMAALKPNNSHHYRCSAQITHECVTPATHTQRRVCSANCRINNRVGYYKLRAEPFQVKHTLYKHML